jgi:hypothetical protein
MGVWETAALAISALTGGLTGAAAAAYLASLRFGSTMEGFRGVIREYLIGRGDEPAKLLGAAYDELEASWKSFGAALDRLVRAAKPRR